MSMAMEQRMQLRQRMDQRLVMTPMMQQAIKLLQLSNIELQDLIQQEIMENVVLEDDASTTSNNEESEPTLLASEELGLAEGNGQHEEEESTLSKGEIVSSSDMEEYFSDTSDYNDYVAPTTFEATYDEMETQIAGGVTLKDLLLRQLHIALDTEREIEVGERIIDQLNEDGYLKTDIEVVAEETDVPVEVAERVLYTIQTFEPAGVGARDIQECLVIQFRAMKCNDTMLLRAITEHLEDLERRRYAQVGRALGVSERRAQDIADALSLFNPFPGRGYGESNSEYISPDVFVEKIGGEWQVRINDEGSPPLRISQRYRRMLHERENLTQEEYDFILDKFRSAKWLIRNIEQRKQTLYKVTKHIAEVQQDFLDYGITALKPLRYRDVADGVGIHEATVCRVVRGKYVQTPRGLFELKFFFSTSLEGASMGEDQSAKSVMVKIQDLIDNEDHKKPLSDQKITDILAKQFNGVNISRRTVAKYRQKMDILPAHQRKRV